MRYLLFVLLFTCCDVAFAKSYIVRVSGQPRIIEAKGFTPDNILHETPFDSDGLAVKTLEDVVILKTNIIACIDEPDCQSKLVGLCDGIDNSRALIKADFTEVYCAKPEFNQALRDARLAAEQTDKDDNDLLRTALHTQRVGLKAALSVVDIATVDQLRQMVKKLIRLQLRE